MKLYHGTSEEFTVDSNRCLYLSPSIEVAREYALGLDSEGNYNQMSYIYELEIDDALVSEEDDFAYFDGMGYSDYDNIAEVTHNAEFDYYCVKHPAGLKLVEKYENYI